MQEGKITMSSEERIQKAEELFLSGFNCAQATFAAFADLAGYSEEEALRLASSFGGGFARQREVCGAVSGAAMALGAVFGYDTPDPELCRRHYALVSEFINGFRERNGAILCRDLLQISKEKVAQDRINPVPTERNDAFFSKRPCAALVADAAKHVCALMKREAGLRALSMLKPGWNSSDRFPGTMDLPIRYQLWIPKNFDPSRRYPVVLYMHGDGTRGSDNLTHIAAPTATIVRSLTENPEYNQDLILFAPQCTREECWVPCGNRKDGFNLAPEPAPCLQHAFTAFSYWLERLPADRERLLFWGNSRGAYAGWDLMSRHPGLFAGAVLVAGCGDSEKASLLTGEHIRIHHGTADNVVLYSGNEQMVKRIKESNPSADINLIPYPGQNHTIFAEVGLNDSVIRWLLSQHR